MGCQGVRRTRKLCRAQQSSITRSRTPSFHRRIRSLSEVGTVSPEGMACPPSRTVRAPFSAHGSPSLCCSRGVLFQRSACACPHFSAWNPRTVSLPLSVWLSTVLLPLIPWLIQVYWLLDPLQAHVGSYGDSVTIQVG